MEAVSRRRPVGSELPLLIAQHRVLSGNEASAFALPVDSKWWEQQQASSMSLSTLGSTWLHIQAPLWSSSNKTTIKPLHNSLIKFNIAPVLPDLSKIA